MSILITTVVSVFIFGLVVMIHELGHFVCAKKAGIQVNEFSIGMGPALFSRVKNGTRYSIRALPVGGYVSMEGEDEELSEDEQFIDPDLPPEAVAGYRKSEFGVTALVKRYQMPGHAAVEPATLDDIMLYSSVAFAIAAFAIWLGPNTRKRQTKNQ